MERFCGSLLRTIKSRQSPFTSLDKRVLHLAQLAQIKVKYNLGTVLDLSLRHSVGSNGHHVEGCKFRLPHSLLDAHALERSPTRPTGPAPIQFARLGYTDHLKLYLVSLFVSIPYASKTTFGPGQYPCFRQTSSSRRRRYDACSGGGFQ